MKRSTRVWLHSLAASAISGGANGVGMILIAPETFNFDGGLSKLGQAVALGVIIGVGGYLKKSPLPDETTDSVTMTASPSGTMSVTATHTESGEQP